MTGKTSAMANSFLSLIFNATTWTSVAINATASPYTNLYWSLHTADPGISGTQTTSEIGYTSYARTAAARTSGGFTISGTNPTQVAPAAQVSFPAGTGGSGTATHFGLGVDASGTNTGDLWYTGTVTPNIVTGNGVTPILTTASTITEA